MVKLSGVLESFLDLLKVLEYIVFILLDNH